MVEFGSAREGELRREIVVVKVEGSGHDSMAVAGDSLATGSGNLGDKPVTSQLHDQSGDALTSAVGFVLIGGWPLVEPAGEIDVSEATNSEVAY